MKKAIVFAFLFIFMSGLVSANHHIELNYQIFGDKTLVEVHVDNVSNLRYKLPVDYGVLEINVNNYYVDENYLIIDTAQNLEFSYITKSLIEETSDRDLFILQRIFTDNVDVMLTLPEGGILDDLIIPDPDKITTDGKNIFVHWEDFEGEEIVVAYKIPVTGSRAFLIALSLFVGLFTIYFIYSAIRSKKMLKKIEKVSKPKKISKEVKKAQTKKTLTRNLFGEEKKIIEYLLDKKGHESWTKEIVRDLDISKVRLSRRLRGLVQRGLIEKIPYGNENRIRLIKK